MKETKKYFNTTRLNKGYLSYNDRREDDVHIVKRKYQHILPPIDVVNEYENLYPGTLEKMIKIAQKEQMNTKDLAEREIDKKYRNSLILRVISLISIVTVLFCMFSMFIFVPMLSAYYLDANKEMITLFGILPFACCLFFMLGIILPKWFWTSKIKHKTRYPHPHHNNNNYANNGKFKR